MLTSPLREKIKIIYFSLFFLSRVYRLETQVIWLTLDFDVNSSILEYLRDYSLSRIFLIF